MCQSGCHPSTALRWQPAPLLVAHPLTAHPLTAHPRGSIPPSPERCAGRAPPARRHPRAARARLQQGQGAAVRGSGCSTAAPQARALAHLIRPASAVNPTPRTCVPLLMLCRHAGADLRCVAARGHRNLACHLHAVADHLAVCNHLLRERQLSHVAHPAAGRRPHRLCEGSAKQLGIRGLRRTAAAARAAAAAAAGCAVDAAAAAQLGEAGNVDHQVGSEVARGARPQLWAQQLSPGCLINNTRLLQPLAALHGRGGAGRAGSASAQAPCMPLQAPAPRSAAAACTAGSARATGSDVRPAW